MNLCLALITKIFILMHFSVVLDKNAKFPDEMYFQSAFFSLEEMNPKFLVSFIKR